MQVKSKKNEYLSALEFALSTDYYENVSYHGDYKGYSVYLAFSSVDVGKFIGMPSFIFVKGDEVRWATTEEKLQFMNKNR